MNYIEDYIFLFDSRPTFGKWWHRDPPIHFDTLGALAAAMAGDPRFSNVRWVYKPLEEDVGVADPLVDARQELLTR